MKLHIDYASEADAPVIVDLVRQGFRPAIVERIIYGCRGIGNFVVRQLRESDCDTKYFVARDGDRIAGFTEFRRVQGAWMLNYVVLAEAYRGQGLSDVLLDKSLSLLRSDPARVILDVFADNVRAVSWYAKRGFTECGQSHWYDVTFNTPTVDLEEVLVHNIAQTEMAFENFGFAMFDFSVNGRRHSVGLMGDGWLRISGPELLSDREALAYLKGRFPARKLFAVLSSLPAELSGGLELHPFLSSLRMEAIL